MALLRVLILNWRDLAHPDSGGAEVYTQEVARRLVDRGNEVTLFASRFDQCEKESLVSGVRIIRNGGKYTVYAKARTYLKDQMNKFDVIIDEINTIPFGAKQIAKKTPVVALIHQLAREIWFYETRFPLSSIGYYALEPMWLRMYKQIPTVTVSDSTKKDLISRGFRDVEVIPNGINITPLSQPTKKNAHPTLMFLGRLIRSKLPTHAIAAFKQVKRSFPNARLWIVGDGYLRRDLSKFPIDGLTFFGRVSEKEKYDLLSKAHILLAPSVREGWGISVIEANAMGTPAIGYDVPGLKDSILRNQTGLLVPSLDWQALAGAASTLLLNTDMREAFSKSAINWAKHFNWDLTAESFENFAKSRCS